MWLLSAFFGLQAFLFWIKFSKSVEYDSHVKNAQETNDNPIKGIKISRSVFLPEIGGVLGEDREDLYVCEFIEEWINQNIKSQ